MNRALILGTLLTALLAPLAAQAQVEIIVGPPAAFVATAEPVYFEGRPAYWWGGRWYWRERGAWRYYHEEPVYLREWRGRRVPGHVFYKREHFRGGWHRR